MSNWAGYFFKKTVNNTDVIFPMRYIAAESWSSTPNQREELKAYRDDNTRNLTRITAAGKKSIFSFKTRKNLKLDEKMEIQDFFTSSESDPEQRKITLTFWDDENNVYKTGTFYRPNMEFKIRMATADDIIYDELQFEFIEY